MLSVVASTCGPTESGTADPTLEIVEPYAPPKPGGTPIGVAYLKIVNHTDQADRLLSVRCAQVDTVETHETVEQNGILRMLHRPNGFKIGAGDRLVLEPGGAHLMLMGLKVALIEGATLPMVLTFEEAGEIEVSFSVHDAL